ncbi:MAG: glycogen/starch/alpha-glucan phosphorylase [Candidatus Methanomethyliaceae archaeon]|nr:glycogen/starch/alpha-glucan phosphorylase [Candidatus Methanomethyliaceae archaeon]MDW7970428.1 glycogen/starch/alpha-glucan phosphorylase [Nitrososphaerota archaeon]
MIKNENVISVTPDIALEFGNTYAGGLGVLEGDKFYAAADLGINYHVLSIYYKEGYVDYEFDSNLNPIPKPQPQPKEFSSRLNIFDEFNINLRNEVVKVQALKYSEKNANAIFFKSISPNWAEKLFERLYIEENTEIKFYKYLLFAKASEAYIRRNISLDEIECIDLQESYAALLPLSLKIPGKYRLVIHTAGPWGHPTFNREFFRKELGYTFVDNDVVLTEIGLSLSRQSLAVSAKHLSILLKVFPHHRDKLSYVTNGICLKRWMDLELAEKHRNYELRLDTFIEIRERLKQRLIDYLSKIKDIDLDNKFIAVWSRRMVPYKRPDFIARLIPQIKDKPIVIVISGKAHPFDFQGLEYMKLFMKLHKEFNNVIYIPNYSIYTAKLILSGADLLLFTPFPGWEACGTSYMKAAVNGIPSLSSIDGGVPEFIINDINGWLFGEDVRLLIEYFSEAAKEINEREYQQFQTLFFKIYEIYRNDPEAYYRVGLNALRTFVSRANMERVLKEYYPNLIRIY